MVRVCTALCTIAEHNTAQNRPGNFLTYPPNNCYCSNDAYLREGRKVSGQLLTYDLDLQTWPRQCQGKPTSQISISKVIQFKPFSSKVIVRRHRQACKHMHTSVGWLEFNVPFQHKYSYIRDERSGVESYPLTQ